VREGARIELLNGKELADASFACVQAAFSAAKSSESPLRLRLRQPSSWTCHTCTYAENALGTAACGVCDVPSADASSANGDPTTAALVAENKVLRDALVAARAANAKALAKERAAAEAERAAMATVRDGLAREVASLKTESALKLSAAAAKLARVSEARDVLEATSRRFAGSERDVRLALRDMSDSDVEAHIKVLERALAMSRETSVTRAADKALCVVCFAAEKRSLLMPCRHLCLCRECAGPTKSCPLCRTPVTSVIDVFS